MSAFPDRPTRKLSPVEIVNLLAIALGENARPVAPGGHVGDPDDVAAIFLAESKMTDAWERGRQHGYQQGLIEGKRRGFADGYRQGLQEADVDAEQAAAAVVARVSRRRL